VEADAVGTRGIVVDKAEVVLAPCGQFSPTTKLLETFWNRSRRIVGVSLIHSSETSVGIYRQAFVVEPRGLVETKYSCPSALSSAIEHQKV